MNYPIVSVETQDGLCLYGLLLETQGKENIFINIHGTASNFYEEPFIETFSKYFIENGISLLSTNNRGAGVYDAYQKSGAATEKFEDCIIDIDTWISFVLDKGYKNIILSGHSLGTEKVVYYMSNGKYADKITSIVLLAPSDSFGSHRLHDGNTNPRKKEVENLLNESKKIIESGESDKFLPRNTYGSHDGIMPKSAYSFMNFLGPESRLLNALPLVTEKLEAYSNIKIPILVAIGDQSEYTGLTIKHALELMQNENKNTFIFQLKNCNHDFDGKEEELSKIVLDFAQMHLT